MPQDPYAAIAQPVADDPYAAIATPATQSSLPDKPESTLKKVARGATLGAFEGVGVKPATTPGGVVTGTVKQFGQGLSDLVGETWRANAPAGGTPAGPIGQVVATGLDLIPAVIERTATSLEQGGRRAVQALKSKDYETAAEEGASTLTQAALLRSPRRATQAGEFKTVGTLRNAARENVTKALGPREVPIAGEKVPALVAEATPGTKAARLQSAAKRSGAGAQRFTDFAIEQQNKVKDVIRKVAKQTSEMVGPISEEPGHAMHDAATATFAKASPMYAALDESLVEIPDGLSDVSKVTEQAIVRAKKWGVELPDQEWNRTAPTTPITTYMKVRSELGKMLRGSSDASQRYAIKNDLALMNSNMETALADTPLLDTWHEADRLWAKGYAIRDVGDAITQSTKGTPGAVQHPSVAKVATSTTGGSLVSRLNNLSDEGVLAKAFTPDEIKNLRQAADILDRSAGPTGQEFGIGYGFHSTWARNAVKLSLTGLVHAMTNVEGVEALKAGALARDAGQASQAFDRFARLAATAGAESGQVKTPGEARDRMRQYAPAP